MSAEDLEDFALAIVAKIRSMDAEARAKAVEKAKGKDDRQGGLLTAEEACQILGVTRGTLWRWDREGLLRKVKAGRKVLYMRKDVLGFIKK
ncbi:MAG: helix-turn-helix domain-containing protein [Prevotella sp.]